MRLAWRMLLRDWRAGELTVLALAIVIAVAAMTTVGFFSNRVQLAMERQADKLLGADLAIDSDHPLPADYRARASEYGLSIAQSQQFPSMVSFDDSSLLTEIKAVGENYPLRGELLISREPGKKAAANSIPPPGSVWADDKLLIRLGLKVGEQIEVGSAKLRVDAMLEQEPDEAIGLLSLGPRVLMNRIDLPATRLVQAGSRVRYTLLLAGEPKALANYRNWAQLRLGRGERIQGIRDARPEIKSVLDRARTFLGTSALMSVLLSAAAIFLAARRFLERHLDGCAVMRVLGIRKWRLFGMYLSHFFMLGLIASAIGAGIGYFAQMALGIWLSDLVDAPLPAPGFLPALQGVATGLVLLLGFALPPIMALGRVPALRVFRREIGGRGAAAGYSLGFFGLLSLFLWQADSFETGLMLFGGFFAALLVWAALAWAALFSIKGGGSGWRLGVSSLKRRKLASVTQIVALSLGLMALLLLTLIRDDLLGSWRSHLPPDAPNRFLVNIGSDQIAPLAAFFSRNNIATPELYPMVKGRLVAINGRPVSSSDYPELRQKRLVDREFNLSWGSGPMRDNRLVSGNWWNDADAGKPWASVEEGLAKTLSIRMHDRLAFDVAGRVITIEVVNLRKVAWDSFRVNFFVMSPPGVLDRYPASYITSFYLPEQRYSLMNELIRSFPNLLLIDVASIMRKVQKIMDQVALAVEFVFLFSMAAGLTVLWAALAATQDERMSDAAILRAIGASRRQLVAAHLAEFLILGSLAGAFAAAGASALGYFVSKRLLDLPFGFDPAVAVAGVGFGAIVVAAVGLFGTRRVLNAPPMLSLRASS